MGILIPPIKVSPLDRAERIRREMISRIEAENRAMEASKVRIEEFYRSKGDVEEIIDALKAEKE